MRKYTPDMVGDILHDFKKAVFDPRVFNMEFGLQMTDPLGFLDTLFVPNSVDTVVELDVRYIDPSVEIYDGAQNPGTVRFYLGTYNNQWRTGFAGVYEDYGTANTNRNIHTLTGEGKRYVNDDLINEYTGSILTQVDSFYLWGKGTYRYPNTVYYGVRMWKGGVLQRELIPIIAGSNRHSEIPAPSHCFWDTVSEQYIEPTLGSLNLFILSGELTKQAEARRDGEGSFTIDALSVSSDMKVDLITMQRIFQSLDVGDLEVVTDFNVEYRTFDKIPYLLDTGELDVFCDFAVQYVTLNQRFNSETAMGLDVTYDLNVELIGI